MVKRMNSGSSVSGVSQRMIIDVSLLLGLGAFMVAQWGYGHFLELLISICYGLLATAVSYFLISQIIKLFQKSTHELEEQHSYTIENPSFLPLPSKKVNNMPAFDHWSSELIDNLEWKVFQDVSIAIWYARGFLLRPIEHSKNKHFHLFSKHNRVKPIGLIMFRNANNKTFTIEELDSFYQVQKKEKLPLAVLSCTGALSRMAKSYCLNHNIKLQNTTDIFNDLKGLKKKQQDAILHRYIQANYAIPTCPSCNIKLIKRQEKKSGKLFWGCVAYPQCRHAIRYH